MSFSSPSTVHPLLVVSSLITMTTFSLDQIDDYDDDEASLPDTASPPPPRTPRQPGDDNGLKTNNQRNPSPAIPGTPNTQQVGEDDSNSQLQEENSPAASPSPVATIRQPGSPFDWEDLNLDTVPPQEFSVRILILPLKLCNFSGHPAGGFCGNWVDVDMRDATEESEPTRLWAIGPGEQQPGFCVTCGKIRCIVFFDPDDDRIIITNKSPHPVSCKRIRTAKTVDIPSQESGVITPGEWEFTTNENECLFQFNLLVEHPYTSDRSVIPNALLPAKPAQARRLASRITIPRGQFPSNPLISLDRGEIIQVGTGENDYDLKLLEPIHDRRCSTVYNAEHSHMPGKIVTVKVIKPHSRRKESAVEAIETWIREFSIHSTFGNHYAIVPYLGSDARFNAIFTEHIDAKPLIYHVTDQESREFNGNIMRAWRILGDMASALSFLHTRKIVHGNVHLTNILFHPVRGAVLTNFNLSFEEENGAVGNAAPWYLPPEFIEDAQSRCSTSDMWALGVVMVWVLGKIPMPESTKHWFAEDIHPTGPTTLMIHRYAQCRMEDWLATVQAGNDELQEEGGEIANLVDALVQQVPHKRITAATLVERLAGCNLNDELGLESDLNRDTLLQRDAIA
ncbi:hypothetical protein RRF57_010755 [Xylaria bambusicola]|uniref:Protein kinase domain-containing protein n=1 Tax=Xylaria bambusicola TaxID=326684 RepID=A0AAN7UX35_9PEZI